MNSISFFLHWLSDPLQVGAIAPSSPALATAITAEITPESAPVIELGPGNGAFTRALIDRGIPIPQLALIERSPRFALALEQRFPDALVLCVDAADLGSIDVFPGEKAGAVVSGLPLLLMSPGKVRAILASAFKCLRPGGAFYQFTYGSRSPVPRRTLEHLGLTATLIGRTLANIPPASVYRIQPCNAQQHPGFHAKHDAGDAKRFSHRAGRSFL
jgi:phospholipid N-methyltransferase